MNNNQDIRAATYEELLSQNDVLLQKVSTLENRIEKSEVDQFRSLLDSTAEGVIGLDKNGSCNYVNKRAIKLLGCSTEDDLLGSDLCPYVHNSSIPDPECDICDSLITGEPIHHPNAVFNRADGTRLRVEYWSHPIVRDNKLTGSVVTFFDITEKVIVEEELQLRSRLLELSHDAIFVWKLDGDIFFWNQGAEAVYGYSSKEAVGQFSHDLLKTSYPLSIKEIYLTMHETGEWAGELVQTTKEGKRIKTSSRLQLVSSLDGTKIVLEINRDITESIETQKQLKQSRLTADLANKAKSRFLANMSHELRTPLTAILGFADILLAEVEDETDHQRLTTIRSNGAYLLDLLNDILDLSKIEAGKLALTKESVDIVKLLEDVAQLMTVRAEAKDLTLDFDLQTALPRTMKIDGRRFRQILVNLLGNAVKFTQQGKVSISASLVKNKSHTAEDTLVIKVIDTGIGITPQGLKRIFKPFEQSASPNNVSSSGTGLGLSISRLLAHELGGEIHVQSELNAGSQFTLTIPIINPSDAWVQPDELNRSSQEPSCIHQATSARLDSSRILVADDRRDIRHIADYFLSQAGAEVLLVEDGQEAVELVNREQQERRKIDLILMDMQMPTLDGYAATKKLLAEGHNQPIIALTASAMKGERERCLSVGCSDYLTKPIDGNRLVEVCCENIRQSKQGKTHRILSEASE